MSEVNTRIKAEIKNKSGEGKKPNVLWIVLDHVTYRHFKMTKGAKPILNTYQRLASEGMEFTECHSVHPLCLPARATMMTGMYSHNHGKIRNGKYPADNYPLFNEYLEKLGYSVGYFGKNHSGYEDLNERGFEGFYPQGYGNPYLTKEYREYLDKNHLENPIYHQEWGVIHNYGKGDFDLTKENNFNTYTAGYFKTPGRVHEADFIISMASDWMEKQSAEKSAFAVRVDMWGPHHAFQVPFEFKDTINAEEIEEYPSFTDELGGKPEFVKEFANNIRANNELKTWKEWQQLMKRAYENYTYIDTAVARLLDKLEQMGIGEDTIVIYTADHGDSLGSHGGMVDKAGDLMEEVMHIPMVIKWPGVTTGVKSHAFVSNLDLVPTVLEMAGIEPPEYMDGRSMVSLLKNQTGNWREDFMAEHYGHFKNTAVQRALYYKNYKYIANEGHLHELYDLEADPFEMNNLIKDSSFRNVLDDMKTRLLRNMEEHGDVNEDTKALRVEVAAI